MTPSDNPVRAKFAEHAFHALGRIEGTPTPRGWLAYATTSTTSGRRTPTPPWFRMFVGEQRAIGELMIREGLRPLECIGYAEFLSEVRTQENVLLNALRADVRRLDDGLPQARPRLAALQHLLIDLLASLDPKNVRFPEDRRTKV